MLVARRLYDVLPRVGLVPQRVWVVSDENLAKDLVIHLDYVSLAVVEILAKLELLRDLLVFLDDERPLLLSPGGIRVSH